MITYIQVSDDKKTIYYQTDKMCDCEIVVIEEGETIILNHMQLVPNIVYFTTWNCAWYNKEVKFKYGGEIQTVVVVGTSVGYVYEKFVDDVIEYKFDKTTPLCEIMNKYGSDKSSRPLHGNLPGHNYTRFYDFLFSKIKDDKLSFFELGLGTNNPELDSNMTKDGSPGASLRAWEEYFVNSKIFGADIDTNILFDDENIMTFYCDQTNPKIIQQLWNQKQLDFDFDIIIEDGLHEFYANKIFLENSIHKIKKGGVFIIEDINIDQIYNWCEYFKDFRVKYPDVEIKFVKLYCEHNRHDNNLIFVKK